MYKVVCPNCLTEIEIPNQWDSLGTELSCVVCRNTYILEYDEYYDQETGDEWDYFYLL